MKNLFALLDFEFATRKNRDWVDKKIQEINDCITNNFFCISVDYKYGEFNDIVTIIFESKKEMNDFKNIESSNDSKWFSKMFFSDKTELFKNIDC
mgnify:CR=1 FL=1